MARSAVTVATAAYNSGVAVTADAVDVSNEHSIDVSTVNTEKLGIRLYGGSAAGFTATFKAGDYADAAIGDLDVKVTALAQKIVVLESARFKDSDKLILIDAASTGTATAATIEAYEIP